MPSTIIETLHWAVVMPLSAQIISLTVLFAGLSLLSTVFAIAGRPSRRAVPVTRR